MQLIADLHLHSRYSRAVSPQMVIPEIARWAGIKGIDLVAAPDWTHSLWLRELKKDLTEIGDGVYGYKKDLKGVKFLLATEISSIYSQGGKTRRIHNLVLAPSLKIVEKINQALVSRGANLLSDGRPIVGLTSIELCELIFSVSKDCLIIPAHAWTPWFSLYGSKSGFDSINECFGKFTDQIYAIETGLSSDPLMNWRVNELDSRSIVSFSDAHSLVKMGREATVFELEKVSFRNITKALKSSAEIFVSASDSLMKEPSFSNKAKSHSQGEASQNLADSLRSNRIIYTIEFYPEEGKYHYTGHRKCKVKQTPEETGKLGKTCPVCGRTLTVGVMHRVEQLATRGSDEVKGEKWEMEGVRGVKWGNRPPYVMLVPLQEILVEALDCGFSSQKVVNEYNHLTAELDSEFNVLLNAKIEEIAKISGEKVAEGVKKVREGDLVIDPGYDGEFGKVKIWSFDTAVDKGEKQMSLL